MYYYLSKLLAPFLDFTNLIFFSLIFFYLINLKLKINKIKILIKINIILFLIVSFLPIGNMGLRYLEKDYIDQKNILNIKNIIVLAGSEDISSTLLTGKLNLNSGSERLISSVKLALINPNVIIYYLGGDGLLIKNKIDETYVAKLFFKDLNFDLKRIKFISNTRNTIENLIAFKEFDKTNQKNILITSAFHMKRATLIASKLNIDVTPYAVDFGSPGHDNVINYYQKFSLTHNLSTFNVFFREMIGILAFKLFY